MLQYLIRYCTVGAEDNILKIFNLLKHIIVCVGASHEKVRGAANVITDILYPFH